MSRHFFGYGSLVNLDTHTYPSPKPATLSGWRRVWRFSPHRTLGYLSVEPHADSTIHGMVAQVPDQDWAALDERERAYRRVDISHALPQTMIYEVDPDTTVRTNQSHRILLSYPDVVIQGYLRLMGPDGAQHFADTTAGWDVPVLNDRACPIYPRAQTLTAQETKTVDDLLDGLATPLEVPKQSEMTVEWFTRIRGAA
ncbi:gamma-glutamylcyclotransferase family protein [Aestuariibius sp. HNIBRBA575]|uniref:gamma-glutamylcyclotransferase family protein n=1 Tax=Aestuariibius sp. HNIBRBA575 TaxID=3233343 RepID=UPI0034A4A6EB